MADWTIHKYPIAVGDSFTALLPEGARLLDVQVQRGVPCLWAEVNPDADHRPCVFYVRGTGHPMGDALGCAYVGTFQLSDGDLVLHLYVRRR